MAKYIRKYIRKYDEKKRMLHVWPDREQVATAGGNVSQEDWDAIDWSAPLLRDLDTKDDASE